MKEITLDELLAEVQAKEAAAKEPEEVTQMIHDTAVQVANLAFYNDQITILTDYDADGLCSAYIMETLLNTIAPDCDVTVECNDRRRAYGLDPDIHGDEDTKYIVCDMGSNQLDLARERLGEDVIIIDHHLIEDDNVKDKFKDNTDNNLNLCNPHSFHSDDSLNAQYCATGLAYRIYQEVEKEWKQQGKHKGELFSEKQDNTVAIMACIGTATDMVDVLDPHSLNREILKDGLRRIDNADEQNLAYNIGYMLARNGIEDEATAHHLAFNVGAYLNAPSRMSEIIQDNGAMLMYQALSGEEQSASTLARLDALANLNAQRKSEIAELTTSDDYKRFVAEQSYGENADKNVAVYQLPDNTPTAFAGLVAGKLAEATDKAIICVSYNSENDSFSGSGRNVASNETSLKQFMDFALQADDKKSDFSIVYGGHEDAIGISALNDINELTRLVDKASPEMQAKPLDERLVLKMSFDEMQSTETFDKLKQLEPIGTGLKIPPVKIDGEEQSRDKLFIKNRDDWKKIKVSTEGKKNGVLITDWTYNPEAYPQSGKKGSEISMLAEVGLNNFKGLHIELTAVHDRAFLSDRLSQIEQDDPQKALKKTTVNRD